LVQVAGPWPLPGLYATEVPVGTSTDGVVAEGVGALGIGACVFISCIFAISIYFARFSPPFPLRPLSHFRPFPFLLPAVRHFVLMFICLSISHSCKE
jgi:hypothetical protein